MENKERFLALCEEAPMFYSSYGSFMHSLIEGYYSGEIPKEDLTVRFLSGFKENVGGERPADSTVEKYIQAGISYLGSFEPFPYKPLEVEGRVDFEIGGERFVGILDFLGSDDDGTLYIIDNKSRELKPRSGRKTPTLKDKELDEMLIQLYIYAVSVKQKYGQYPGFLCFNCFKNQTFIKEKFDEQKCEAAVRWALDSIEQIKNAEEFRPKPDYFKCQYICGLHDECEYYQMR